MQDAVNDSASEPTPAQQASPPPTIKEKEVYIQSQPGEAQNLPGMESISHRAAEQGRQYAIQQREKRVSLSHEHDETQEPPSVQDTRKSSASPPSRPFPERERNLRLRETPEVKSARPRSAAVGRIKGRSEPSVIHRQPTAPHPLMRQRMQAVFAEQGQRLPTIGEVIRRVQTGIQRGSRTVRSFTAVSIAGVAGLAAVVILLVVLFGGLLNLTGGGYTESLLPVSEEVRAYEPVIRTYAAQYGIPEYAELIMAVMMQESGGRGLDPMQAAEGGFNTRYPHVPNGITDPDYSIQCGVQELKAALERGGVQSPIDMEHIKLALQGYNYGPGYITWAVSHYGGYSAANAAEFSDLQAARLGWRRYGDKEYVPHVLRYYPYGRMPAGFGNDAIVQIALSQEGNDGTIYWTWFGNTSRVEWCSEFASWCAYQAGLIQAGLAPRTSVCTEGVAWFRERGRFVDASYVPVPGNFIYFDWEQDGHTDHVGIVEYVEDGQVHTVEGNSGDRVRRSSYDLNSAVIFGYGV